MRWVLRRVTARILYDLMIFRWITVIFLLLVVASWLLAKRLPWLEKLGLTKFKSEWSFSVRGRIVRIPVTMVLLLFTMAFIAANLLFKWLK